jgi:hypothetical protein
MTVPTEADAPTTSGRTEFDSAQRAFSTSVLVSAVRCTLTYVVFPFLAPLVGLAPGVGPVLGLVIGTIAIVANVFSIRRFWRARHPWRVPVSAINVGIIVLVAVLMFFDLRELFG